MASLWGREGLEGEGEWNAGEKVGSGGPVLLDLNAKGCKDGQVVFVVVKVVFFCFEISINEGLANKTGKTQK